MKIFSYIKQHIALLLSACLVLPLFSGCAADETPYSKTGFYFDTIITVTVYGKKNEKVLDGCMDLAKKYDNLLSTTKENSDIYKINNSNGIPIEVASDTAELINKGLHYGELSGHAFSICCGALTSLWDFEDNSSGVIPSEEDIQTALKTIDDSKVEVSGNTVTLLPISETDSSSQETSTSQSGANDSASQTSSNDSAYQSVSDDTSLYPQLDLGGIAKGFIADKMKEYLQDQGISSAIINLGGNVLTIGSRPNGEAFNVGIQKPFSDDGTAACTVKSQGSSIVTSGTYQRYFEKDGRIFHHILNLTTGYPEDNDLSSVTIISDKSTDGDALSTTCFLLGEDKARKLLSSLGNSEAIFIDTKGNITYTDGLKGVISLTK